MPSDVAWGAVVVLCVITAVGGFTMVIVGNLVWVAYTAYRLGESWGYLEFAGASAIAGFLTIAVSMLIGGYAKNKLMRRAAEREVIE